MRDEPVPAGEIDDPPAAKSPPRPPRDLPRLVELLAREAARRADDARDVIEERRPLEARELVRGEAHAAGEAVRRERGARRDGRHEGALSSGDRPARQSSRRGHGACEAGSARAVPDWVSAETTEPV